MLLWGLLWSSGVLGKMDMKEKLFAFPKESSTSHVKLIPELRGPFGEATVCMRFHSDLTRHYSLFSLATDNNIDNAFLLYYYPGSMFSLSVNNNDRYYYPQDNDFTEWTSICAAWNSSVWVVQIDGKVYKKNVMPNGQIKADASIIIGQEQDSYGGSFSASDSFVGEITDLNMWDKALTDGDMLDYFAGNEMNGNVLNWNALNYTITEDVNRYPYVDPYPCIPV
ncbi:serum amyloid [Pristimantis euphronides]